MDHEGAWYKDTISNPDSELRTHFSHEVQQFIDLHKKEIHQ